MILKTERLILRPFAKKDAASLYKYASNPKIGPSAGWSAHRSLAESQTIIETLLSGELIFAIVLKAQPDEVIGCIDLTIAKRQWMSDEEGEIGYWIGEPFWGRGLIPEATIKVLDHGFNIIGLKEIWCTAAVANKKSQKVQEKVGFKYVKTLQDVCLPLLGTKEDQRLSKLTASEWLGRS